MVWNLFLVKILKLFKITDFLNQNNKKELFSNVFSINFLRLSLNVSFIKL